MHIFYKMIKKPLAYFILLLCSVCTAITCYAQVNTDKGDFRITGQVGGRDTGLVVLWYRDIVNEVRTDTTALVQGRFTFSGNTRGACEALIWTNLRNKDFDDQSVIRFILTPGFIDVSKTDGVKKARISGSPAQAEKDRWDSVKATLTAAEDQRLATADSLKKLERQTGQLSLKDQINALYQQCDSLRRIRFRLDVGYAAKHPESYLGGYLLSKRCRILPVDSVMLLYMALADSVKNSTIGYEVLSYVYPLTNDTAFRNKYPLIDAAFTKRLAAIKSIHDFSLRDMSGKLVNFSAFKGKYLLVDVWASWCGPCIKRIPVWNALVKEYDPNVIQFMTVSLDTDVDSWKEAVQKHKPGGFQFIDTDAFKGLFAMYCKVLWVAKYLVVDPTGRIVNYDADRDNETEWRKLLDGYLKKRG